MGLGHDLLKEPPRHCALQDPGLVLGGGGRIEGRVPDVQVQEPLKEEIGQEPLAELAFAAHREQRDEPGAIEQVLQGIDGRPASAYMASKVGDSSAIARSTMGLICRIGWSFATSLRCRQS